MPKKPDLHIVSPATPGIEPLRRLGKHGRALWNAIQGEFAIDDSRRH